MKTSELIGPALDWAVASCVWTDRQIIAKVGCRVSVPVSPDVDPNDSTLRFFYEPSTNWEQGGPIIEREEIDVYCYESPKSGCGWWVAEITGTKVKTRGNSYLVAAMRCYVASKLGDEIEIPEELKWN